MTESVTSSELSGLRILVVEDEAAISLLLEDMLLDFGCEVIGPAARLAAALDAVSKEQVDLAILDVNVAGEPIYPVAEALAQRSIPFVFSTGYGSAGIRDTFRDRPVPKKIRAGHEQHCGNYMPVVREKSSAVLLWGTTTHLGHI